MSASSDLHVPLLAGAARQDVPDRPQGAVVAAAADEYSHYRELAGRAAVHEVHLHVVARAALDAVLARGVPVELDQLVGLPGDRDRAPGLDFHLDRVAVVEHPLGHDRVVVELDVRQARPASSSLRSTGDCSRPRGAERELTGRDRPSAPVRSLPS